MYRSNRNRASFPLYVCCALLISAAFVLQGCGENSQTKIQSNSTTGSAAPDSPQHLSKLKTNVEKFTDLANQSDKKALDEAAQEVKTALKAALSADPVRMVDLEEVKKAIVDVENTERYDVAGQLFEIYEDMLKDNTNEEVAQDGAAVGQRARLRLGMIGNSLDLSGKLLDGQDLDWGSYKGKVVLVDFWATWCPPCIEEMPNIKKNFKTYRDQGFEVLGINLDSDREKVLEFYQKNGISWPTVFFEDAKERGEKTKENVLAAKYGIPGIPTAILVGKDGKVVSIKARGGELGEHLAQLLGSDEKEGSDKEPVGVAELLDFIDQTRAKRPVGATRQEQIENFIKNQQAIVSATDTLLKEPQLDEPKRTTAILAKLEALELLVRFDSKGAQQSLQTYVDTLSDNKDPEIISAKIGALVILVQADSKGAQQSLQKYIDTLEPKRITLISAKIMALVILVQADSKGAQQALQKYLDTLSDNKDLSVTKIVKSAKTFLKILPAMKIVESIIEGDAEQESKLMPKIQMLLRFEKKIGTETLRPGPEVRDFVGDAARDLEYADRPKMALEIHKLIRKTFGEDEAIPIRSIALLIASSNKAILRLGLVGKTLDLKGKQLDGTDLDWATFKGKVVLVDFWATWCGPCIAEMPNLKNQYQLYHDRGFEVVGISIDTDRQKLEGFVKNHKIPWTILFHDKPLRSSWDHPKVDEYGISGIPAMFLVDQSGKVITLSARGEKLGEYLEKLLGPIEEKDEVDKADN